MNQSPSRARWLNAIFASLVSAALFYNTDTSQGAATVANTPASENPLSFFDGRLTFDMQDRLRLEVRQNNFDFNSARNVSTDDTWLLQRFRLGLSYQPESWLAFYAQGQDVREIQGQRQRVPFVAAAEGDDPFDLRQAYVYAGNPANFPLSLKIGRQELAYGEERLIGVTDWNNFARTFDAVVIRGQDAGKTWFVDGFAAHVVNIHGTGPAENEGFNFDGPDWHDTVAGVYGSSKCLPFQTTEAYFIYRNKTQNGPVYADDLGNVARPYDIRQEIYTLGFRVASTPGQLLGYDYQAEAAYQFGRDQGRLDTAYPNTAGTMLDHEAFAATIKAGHTWEDAPMKPRLGLEYDVASGDSNPNDRKDESFLNLIPTNHRFYGYMDFFAWKNIQNPSVSAKINPCTNVTVQLDGLAFWLYSNEDAWYRANAVTQVRPVNDAARTANKFVGSELDLTVSYTPWRWLKLQSGYSHFFAGQYARDTQTPTAGGDDADFGYLQATVTF